MIGAWMDRSIRPTHNDSLAVNGYFYVRTFTDSGWRISMRYYDSTDSSWWLPARSGFNPNNSFEEWHQMRSHYKGEISSVSSTERRCKSMDKILEEIKAERARQDQKWGGPGHDDTHSAGEWGKFIVRRANKLIFRLNPNLVLARQMLIEIAALAVAAIESLDRKKEAEGGQTTDTADTQ